MKIKNLVIMVLVLVGLESFSPALTQAGALPLVFSSSSSPSSGSKGEGRYLTNNVVNLAISFNGKIDLCAGHLLNEKWMITAAHCFASGFPLDEYIISGDAGSGSIKELFFEKNVDLALARLDGEFEVPQCTPLSPRRPEQGEMVEVYLQGKAQKLPFIIKSGEHIASNPFINIEAHPMISLSPDPSGRLTQPGESGAPVFSKEANEPRYLKGIISGISTQQGSSLAEDIFRHQDFIITHAGECNVKR